MLGRNKTDPEQKQKAAKERQHNRQMEQTAMKAAASKSQSVTENANLLRALKEAGIDTEKYHWLSNELGPELADAHVTGNRSEGYEQEIKWGNIGKSMQMIAERSPGRHCRDERALAIAQNTHRRRDKTPDVPYTVDEQRAVRSAFDAVTNYQSMAVEGRGLTVIGETTVTARREVHEEEQSAKEKAGGFLD